MCVVHLICNWRLFVVRGVTCWRSRSEHIRDCRGWPFCITASKVIIKNRLCADNLESGALLFETQCSVLSCVFMVAEASTKGPIQAASTVGRMASGVEHACEGNSGERATLNHRQGLCVRSRTPGRVFGCVEAGQYLGAGEGAILNGNCREERTFPVHRK